MKQALVLFSFIVSPSFAADISVVDGDTIQIAGTTYRINGIDAPEFGQFCQSASGEWPCGKVALDELASLVEGKDVRCEPIAEDGYGRIIATCFANGTDIGKDLVARGYAWAFVKYSEKYAPEETRARSRSQGIWQADTQPAWEFRAEKWASAEQEAPAGCPIKGNISENGRIYHPPWSPWYSRTRINEAKGERWFCSEAEAVAAGWRAPNWR